MKYICPEEARTRIGNLKYLEELGTLAKYNRNNPTPAEKLFWQKLKKYKYAFLRQKPIYRFIIDFYCSKLLLAIEIDGGYHNNQKNRDKGRDDLLVAMGIKTVRFNNERVISDTNNVFLELERIMGERKKELR